MKHDNLSTVPARILATYLAELLTRLRRSSLSPVLPPHGGAGPFLSSGEAAALSRLRVAAALLTCGGPDGSRPQPDLAYLGSVVEDLASFLSEAHDRGGTVPDLPLLSLAERLEEALREGDTGRPASETADDPGWLEVRELFRRRGTALAIFDRMETGFLAWTQDWGSRELPAVTEAQLRREWLRLRSYGDALFLGGGGRHRHVDGGDFLLLVDSEFRRRQLVDILRDAGLSVVVADGPEGVCQRIAAGSLFRGVLCDNTAPRWNLVKVSEAWMQSTAPEPPPLIMIQAGGPVPQRPGNKVRAVGRVAAGIWEEPFRIGELLRLCPDAPLDG